MLVGLLHLESTHCINHWTIHNTKPLLIGSLVLFVYRPVLCYTQEHKTQSQHWFPCEWERWVDLLTCHSDLREAGCSTRPTSGTVIFLCLYLIHNDLMEVWVFTACSICWEEPHTLAYITFIYSCLIHRIVFINNLVKGNQPTAICSIASSLSILRQPILTVWKPIAIRGQTLGPIYYIEQPVTPCSVVFQNKNFIMG